MSWIIGVIALSFVIEYISKPCSLEITAISLSSKYMVRLVYSIKGEASEAIKYSSLPIPMAKGLPNLATTTSSGRSSSITAMA